MQHLLNLLNQVSAHVYCIYAREISSFSAQRESEQQVSMRRPNDLRKIRGDNAKKRTRKKKMTRKKKRRRRKKKMMTRKLMSSATYARKSTQSLCRQMKSKDAHQFPFAERNAKKFIWKSGTEPSQKRYVARAIVLCYAASI